MWTTFLYGFMAGVAATPHCLGMCGGFPLHLAKSSGKGNAISRQLIFVIGKAFTYVFLGAIASAFGAIVFKNTPLAAAATGLRLAVGVLTVLFGVLMMGIKLPRIRILQGASDTGLVRSLFSGLMSAPGLPGAFVLGLGTGFLPCPLPMAMLGISAASHHVPSGMLLMAGLGVGTAPGLLAVGLFGVRLERSFAKVGMRLAGIMVIFVGLLTISRAAGIVHPKAAVNKVIPSCCGNHVK